MGFLAALLGVGLRNPVPGFLVIAAFYAAHHVLLKGGLFLSVGLAEKTRNHRWLLILLPSALLGLGLAGLPLTGGYIAKLVVKESFGEEWLALLAALSSAGTALLMTHFVVCLSKTHGDLMDSPMIKRLRFAWILLVVASVAAPWIIYLQLGLGTFEALVAPATLWKSLWPVVVGGAVAFGIRRWGRVPEWIPPGDIIAFFSPITKAASAVGRGSERTDWFLRQWPVACLSFLILVLIVVVASHLPI